MLFTYQLEIGSFLVDVRDFAAVAVQALTKNNDGRHNRKAYDITGPQAISYEYAAKFCQSKPLRKYLM